MAAGMLALSMYIAASGAGGVTAFRAGNLSVEMAGGESAADTLRRQAELLLSGYIEDQGFAFRCIDSGGACACARRGRKKKNKGPRPDKDESGGDTQNVGDTDNPETAEDAENVRDADNPKDAGNADDPESSDISNNTGGGGREETV